MKYLELAKKFLKKRESIRSVKPVHKYLIEEFAFYIQNNIGDGNYRTDLAGSKQVIEEDLTGSLKAAVITEEIGHQTGGRYYAWFIAVALMELGYDVTVYTNRLPEYHCAFEDYKNPKVQIINPKTDIANLDIRADLYISSPLLGNIAVTKLREKYNKPCFCMVYDPIPAMKKYLGASFNNWDELERRLIKTDVNILSLCKSISKYIPDWLNKREDQIFPIYPCINSKELKKVPVSKREDYVVFVSRLVKHKNFPHVVRACKEAGVRLKVISSNDGIGTAKIVNELVMKNKVDFYFKVSDKEKFEIISKARAMINGAIFEGFGMWAAEAVACGTPVVAYDFPTLREIQEYSGVDNFYLAKWDSWHNLAEKLKVCLSENKIKERSDKFDFERMIERVSEVFMPEPKIGVISIALNEEQFIGASLKSVIRHPNVSKVVVVEGAVNLMAHASDDHGLSVDKTEDEIYKVMKRKDGYKIFYERYGWALDKSELRNRALKLMPKDVTHILVLDADEVYRQEDLDLLVDAIKKNPRTGVFTYKFLHFFKNKNQIAVGGQWDMSLFRCFAYHDKTLYWERHEMPVMSKITKRYIHKTHGIYNVPGMDCFHFGYMKDSKRVDEKLEYYKKRDTKFPVRVGFDKWKKGEPTSFTHDNGEIKSYSGEYPEEVKDLI